MATAEILQGMILSNNVSSTKCANYIGGDAKKDSKIKRVERFYAKGYLGEALFGRVGASLNLDGIILFLRKHTCQMSSID